MENFDEVRASDFLKLMRGFLTGQIDARGYQKAYFALMKRRTNLAMEEFEIIQQAFVDADDYDPEVRLEYTIEEPELKKRVANSVEELSGLGYTSKPASSS
jgi:hypothetical protein